MKILSIDVGIKNLAYCIIECCDNSNNSSNIDNNSNIDNSSNKLSILDWNVINLCEENPRCCYKVNNNVPCNKCTSFHKDNLYYCKTHAKKMNYILCSDIPSLADIKKKNKNDLLECCSLYNIKGCLKKDIINNFKIFYENSVLQLKKTNKTSKINIVDIGISIIENLKCINTNDINTILIENQIGPLAIRMKTIQGMLTQYFIMNGNTSILFVSASNKLKPFITKKTTYKERKLLGIQKTKDLLNIYDNKWINTFNLHNKKDDLADSFLQAIWYLIHIKKLNI